MGIGAKSDDTLAFHGLTVPAWFTTVWYRPDVAYSVTVFVRVDPELGPLAEGVQVNSAPGSGLTYRDAAALLKGQPVDELLHNVLLMSAKVTTWQGGLDRLGKPTGRDLTDEEQAILGAVVEQQFTKIDAVQPPVRRRSVTKQLLAEVAEVYRESAAAGRPPTQAVAAHFTATHSSAARWVREARRAGVLGPALGPTAGERSTSSE